MSNNIINYYCPYCNNYKLIDRKIGFQCSNGKCLHSKAKNFFIKKNNIPILISEKLCDTVVDLKNISSYVKRPNNLTYRLKTIFIDDSSITKKNAKHFFNLIKKKKKPRILIIGSGERGKGSEIIWNDRKIERQGIDVYITPTVDVVCDAHYLPFKESEFDGVWIQAVLEHVVEPKKVVDEIYRVLKKNGIVYAETPFMQQVHEGAYDFTRFTVLGHRYLFKNFSSILIGANKGTETVLAWAIKYFFWSIFRNRKLASFIGIIFQLILRPFSILTSKKSLYDGSSGVYFMGQKKKKFKLSHKGVIKLYKGHF